MNKTLLLGLALLAAAIVAQEKVITLDKPIVQTNSVSTLRVVRVLVLPEDRKAIATVRHNLGETEVTLWEAAAYDSSGLTNFWPAVEARIKALAADGQVPIQ